MSDEIPVYSVMVSREADLWVAVVDGIPAGATDVERFEELPAAVRDLISALLDVEPDSFWIDWHYRHGDRDLTKLIEHLHEWEDLAERATRNRDANRRAAVETLHSAGLSYRAIADVVGISHQRVGQLLATPRIDIAWPDTATPAQWAERIRNTERPLSPVEAALTDVLRLALHARPDTRPEILSTAASLLEAAAQDRDLLLAH